MLGSNNKFPCISYWCFVSPGLNYRISPANPTRIHSSTAAFKISSWNSLAWELIISAMTFLRFIYAARGSFWGLNILWKYGLADCLSRHHLLLLRFSGVELPNFPSYPKVTGGTVLYAVRGSFWGLNILWKYGLADCLSNLLLRGNCRAKCLTRRIRIIEDGFVNIVWPAIVVQVRFLNVKPFLTFTQSFYGWIFL